MGLKRHTLVSFIFALSLIPITVPTGNHSYWFFVYLSSMSANASKYLYIFYIFMSLPFLHEI